MGGSLISSGSFKSRDWVELGIRGVENRKTRDHSEKPLEISKSDPENLKKYRNLKKSQNIRYSPVAREGMTIENVAEALFEQMAAWKVFLFLDRLGLPFCLGGEGVCFCWGFRIV